MTDNKLFTVTFPPGLEPSVEPKEHKLDTKSVEIELFPSGGGRVVVNGVNISSVVCAFRIEHRVNGPKTVLLELIPAKVRVKMDADVLKAVEALTDADSVVLNI